MIPSLLKYSTLKLSYKLPDYKRFLLDKINFNTKLIGLIGARGAGKTTIVLQYLKELDLKEDEYLYISCEHPIVASHTLFEIAEEFAKYGGKVLVIDEIHKKKSFCVELKNIYDFFDLKVIFTGSSAISLEECQSDLSRRAIVYRLPILSFREFLELETNKKFNLFTLDEILQNHFSIASNILKEIKPLKYYKEYLKYGSYPFFLEEKELYHQRLVEIVNETLTFDVASIYNVPYEKIEYLNKLLETICRSKPYEINYEELSSVIGIAKNTLKQYLLYLYKGNLINTIDGMSRGNSFIKKPSKIYLNNTNLFEILCENNEIGTTRETFFVSQLNFNHKLHYPKKGDFLVDEKYLIEVGGKNKSYKQIKDIENSFIVADDIEVGFGSKIPLYLFGFLY